MLVSRSGAAVRIVASVANVRLKEGNHFKVISGGTRGPQGIPGSSSVVGGNRYYGEGPPGVVLGASPGDEYVNSLNGDLYRLE